MAESQPGSGGMPGPTERRRDRRPALRRLQEALREEMRSRAVECRYVAGCPVARAGACPGIC
jgi:hypothetical protein